MKVCAKIREQLDLRGWKIIDLINKSNLSSKSTGKPSRRIYNMINGRTPPDEATLRAFAAAFDMPEDDWHELSPDNEFSDNYKMTKIVRAIRDYLQKGICHKNLAYILFFVALSKNKSLLSRNFSEADAISIRQNMAYWRIMYLAFKNFNANHSDFYKFFNEKMKSRNVFDILSRDEITDLAVIEFATQSIPTEKDSYQKSLKYTEDEAIHAAYYCLINNFAIGNIAQ